MNKFLLLTLFLLISSTKVFSQETYSEALIFRRVHHRDLKDQLTRSGHTVLNSGLTFRPIEQDAGPGSYSRTDYYYNYVNGYKIYSNAVRCEFEFRTNSRDGNNLTTNIDTVFFATYKWIPINQQKSIIDELYKSLKVNIEANVNSKPTETTIKSKNTIVTKSEWNNQRLRLIYHRKEKYYDIIFDQRLY